MLRLIYIFVLVFLYPFCVNGQQFHFRKYSLEEGLSRSGVYYIMQDDAGFIWVGTEGGGACKFDGIKFTNYTRHNGLASENVRVIFQDDRGVIWFGTANGLTYYNGKEFNSLYEEDGLADNFVRTITQDADGNLWVGTNRGISIIDPDEKGISGKLNFNFNLPHKKVRSLITQGNAVWIGTDRGLCKYHDHQIDLYTEAHGLSHDLILTMFLDTKNKLWVGTQDGLNRINGDTIDSWTLLDGLVHNRVRSITEDRYGNIWLGTTQGISIYDGEEFISLSTQNGLSNERIRCVTNDNFENIWIGTYFGGIMKFHHQDFISYTPNEGLVSNQILAINEDESGNIIVGTYDGVSKLRIVNDKLKGSETIDLKNGLYSNSVRAVLKDKNHNFWYGTDVGITIIREDGISQIGIEDGLSNTEITVIQNFDDKYWIGTRNGLAIIDESEDYENFDIKFLTVQDGLAGREVSGIIEDDLGEVWVSFIDGEVSVFHHDKFVNPVIPKTVTEIMSIGLDSTGQIWLGTNGNGMYYGTYHPKTHEMDLKNISKHDGMVSNSIYSMLILKNQVWAGHENGIDLINWDNDSSFTIRTFGPESGFFGMQNNQNSSYIDTKGNLWFGTVNGLFCLKQKEIKLFTEGHPSINYISSVRVDGASVDWKDSDWNKGTYGQYNLPKDLQLPYDQNNMSFEFIALNFISPEKVKYSWKLEGFDKEWCPPTAKNYASYTNLEPGNYSFKLRSSDEHSIITGEEVTFEFKINKPFWETWVFRIAAAILIAFAIWGIMRLRTRKLIKQRTALEQIVAERTEEIQSQADELKLKNKEVTDSILYSKRIQKSILPGREKMRNILDNYFVFYKPKDIVSGDFYWAEQSRTNENLLFFAAADCTGHGVPGAMVSLIGTRALSASVHEAKLTDPAKILDNTKKIMVEAFTDAESGEIIKDGMDIALCSLDYSDKNQVKMIFSGAHNPVWVVRKKAQDDLIVNGETLEANLIHAEYKLFEIKGDKQPIGYFENSSAFEQHECYLKEGDSIYVFTDGYADQFGGPKGKKFKYKTLKKLILSKQHLSLAEQKEAYKSTFHDWKGDIEQLDDVCVIGVRLQ